MTANRMDKDKGRRRTRRAWLFACLLAALGAAGCDCARKQEAPPPPEPTAVEPAPPPAPVRELPDGQRAARAFCDAVVNKSVQAVKPYLVPGLAELFEITDSPPPPVAAILDIYKTSRSFRTCAPGRFFVLPCEGDEEEGAAPFPLDAWSLDPEKVAACGQIAVFYSLHGVQQSLVLDAYLMGRSWQLAPPPAGFALEKPPEVQGSELLAEPPAAAAGAPSTAPVPIDPRPGQAAEVVYPTPESVAHGYCDAILRADVNAFLYLFLPRLAQSLEQRFRAGIAMRAIESCEILEVGEMNCAASDIYMDARRRNDLLGADQRFHEACGFFEVRTLYEVMYDDEGQPIPVKTVARDRDAELFKVHDRWYIAVLGPERDLGDPEPDGSFR